MKFLGRKEELKCLQNWHQRRDTSFLTIIYGRRRVGKTRLVEEASKNSSFLNFEGIEGQPSKAQKQHFLNRLAELSGHNEYKLIKQTSWTEILILLSQYIAKNFGKKPLTIFFDEFSGSLTKKEFLIRSYLVKDYIKTLK